MRCNFLFLAACCAFLGVGFGAFGAHGLKSILTPDMLAAYKTGVMYQMWHALGLAIIAILLHHSAQPKLLIWAGWTMFSGIILFSGSLYLMAIFSMKWLGMMTPLGGLAFLTAWLLLCVYAYQNQNVH